MTILIVHDEEGNIRSIAILGSNEERCAGLRVQRGEFVMEVEAESVDFAGLRRNPREFCESFGFDRDAGRLLVKNP